MTPFSSRTKTAFISNASLFSTLCCSAILLLFATNHVLAQQVPYRLSDLVSKHGFVTENRTVSALGEKNGVKVSAREGSGVAWVKNVSFSSGTIEVDLRGKDVKQGSFLGIAFRGESKDDCEVIYFRPFNFQAKDSFPRAHMVQYVQDTLYGWERLRNEHPGVYENTVRSAPNANDWFHVKIEVRDKIIKVYVNNSPAHTLEVKSLGRRGKGMLGLWVGASSDGDFANLIVTHR